MPYTGGGWQEVLWKFVPQSDGYYRIQAKNREGTSYYMRMGAGNVNTHDYNIHESTTNTSEGWWGIVIAAGYTPLEKQETRYWCWAASARMITLTMGYGYGFTGLSPGVSGPLLLGPGSQYQAVSSVYGHATGAIDEYAQGPAEVITAGEYISWDYLDGHSGSTSSNWTEIELKAHIDAGSSVALMRGTHAEATLASAWGFAFRLTYLA